MSANVELLMDEAREAIVKKDSQVARRLLRQVTRQDPNNHRAWLWLAGVTDAPDASLQYVKRAAAIAPSDERVIDAMRWATERLQRHSNRPKQPNRVVAVDRFAPEAEIEEVRKPVNPWLRRLGIGLILLAAGFALFTIYRQAGLISVMPEAPVTALQNAFVGASMPPLAAAFTTESDPLVAVAASAVAEQPEPQKKSPRL